MICYFRKPVLPIEKELNSSDSSCYKHNDSADVEAMCGKMLRMKKTCSLMLLKISRELKHDKKSTMTNDIFAKR